MPKMTLYVDEALKARMDAVDKINWSQAAQQAFLGVLASEEWKMDGVQEPALERLRASKGRYVQKEWTRGQEAGREWALTQADYEELEGMSRLLDEDGHCKMTVAEIRKAMAGNAHACCGDEAASNYYARGFVDGATDVFRELAPKL